MKVANAKSLPQVFYGLHMVEGVAEYKEPQTNNGLPYRIFVGESCIKNMDASFQGRPVYVGHVDDVNMDKLQEEADGFVVRSFFNKADGKHWVEFMVISDKAKEAIRNGWKLSNAYIPKKFSGGGLWHGVEYAKEVEEGEYEHLALVPNPRYEESIILTPEEFRNYNQEKEVELKKLSNSITKGAKSMFNFFKKTKVENDADFESMSVVLPKSKKEMSISDILFAIDEMHIKVKNEESEKEEEKEENESSVPKDAETMANMDHYVQCGDKKMKLNEMVDDYMKMKSSMEEPKEEPKKENEEEEEKQNDESLAEKAKENEEVHVDIDSHKGKMESSMDDKEALEKTLELAEHEMDEMKGMKNKKKNAAHFDLLANAEARSTNLSQSIQLSQDLVARGKARYGSTK